MSLYRGMDRAALDAAYNNSLAVADSPQIVAGWEKRGAAFRSLHSQNLDLRYGPAERNRIDCFEARPGAPMLVYIHGGYWQSRSKEIYSLLAEGPLAHGIGVALVGYTLAPEKRLDGIVQEILDSISFLSKKFLKNKIYVSGWSAGGHLTAMAMSHPAVQGGLAISGIYDLEPIRLCYLNEKLRLDEAEARRNSPLLHLPKNSAPLLISFGKNELPELQRQSEDYWRAWQGAGLPGKLAPLVGHNHFTILEELASPSGRLTALVRTLMEN